jgi:short-subunit dehydrogenase
MGKRIIECSVSDEYLLGGGVPIGAAGSHDDVVLRLAFGDAWAGLNIYATFTDALGQQSIVVLLLPSMLVPGEAMTYDVPIPAVAKRESGRMLLGLTGYMIVNGNEDMATHTAEAFFRVLPSKVALADDNSNAKYEHHLFDLTSSDYSFFEKFNDIDTLMITAGFGKLALFKDVNEQHIIDSMNVNTTAVMRLIHHFYDKIEGKADFHCGVMVSIAGFMSSPFFAVYGASKAALKIFIESINVELEKCGTSNRILNVSPGSIKGTSFNQGKTDLEQTAALAKEIIENLEARNDLFIPQYDEIFKEVLARYRADFREEGRHSYEYKLKRYTARHSRENN